MPVDDSTIDANVKSNDCDATDRSLCHIETTRGSREGFYGFCTAIICVEEHDGCHDSSIGSRGEARVSRCSHNFSEVAAMATSDGGHAKYCAEAHAERGVALDNVVVARSEGGCTRCFDAVCSEEGGTRFAARSDEGEACCLDVADSNKPRGCSCVDAATLSDGGGHCNSLIANGEDRATIARVELGTFAETRFDGGDCGNNTVASNQADSDRACPDNSVCLISKQNSLTNKSSDESQTFYTTHNDIIESVDEPQTFGTTPVPPFAPCKDSICRGGIVNTEGVPMDSFCLEEGKKVGNTRCNLDRDTLLTSTHKRKRRY